jgi:hypothetical protein
MTVRIASKPAASSNTELSDPPVAEQYHRLFERALRPILLVDANAAIRDANARLRACSAAPVPRLFGAASTTYSSRPGAIAAAQRSNGH